MANDVVVDLLACCQGKRLIVFDYDGTLARLSIDWDRLRADLQAEAAEHGFHALFRPLWRDMGRFRDYRGHYLPALFSIIERYERAGADGQEPIDPVIRLVRELTASPVSTRPLLAVFSANLHATIERGLVYLGIRDRFQCLVGADDVTAWKPAPEGLNRIRELVGVSAEETLFIGDSDHDERAARACGVSFRRVTHAEA